MLYSFLLRKKYIFDALTGELVAESSLTVSTDWDCELTDVLTFSSQIWACDLRSEPQTEADTRTWTYLEEQQAMCN